MIGVVYGPEQSTAAELVIAALRRSLSGNLLGVLPHEMLPIEVSIGPVGERRRGRGKRIHFGALTPDLRLRLKASDSALTVDPAMALAPPAPSHGSSESPLAVQYLPASEKLGSYRHRRPFVRYDFADEWNNMGFGAIRGDGSIWAIAEATIAARAEIAMVVNESGQRVCSYAALLDDGEEAVLWFNRTVGPIDSLEWRLVELFLSSYRARELPVVPVLREVPFGHDALVIARLDCDEEIESARPLWQAYQSMDVPLSLAIHTQLLSGGAPPLLVEAAKHPGSILSHSATHPASWGGSYELALDEARQSADTIESATGQRPQYAVSPFHLTPDYALLALADAGYRGCIGGSISGPPAFVMARSGVPLHARDLFVGHTAQCMLHGDCLLEPDSLRVYREAFDLAFEHVGIFSYLDHPFSARYSYGWQNESQRIEAHRAMIAYIRSRARAPLFLTAGTAMDFLAVRAGIRMEAIGDRFLVSLQPADPRVPRVGIEFAGAVVAATDQLELS